MESREAEGLDTQVLERRITGQFIEEALWEWDKLEGLVPPFPCYIRAYVMKRWVEYASSN